MMKVARILSRTKLVITRDKEIDLKRGTVLVIKGNSNDPIKDPDTNKVIGFLPETKGRVEVKEIHTKYIIASVYPGRVENFSKVSWQKSILDMQTKDLEKNFLHVRSSQIDPINKSDAKPIEIGDKVFIQ